MNKLILSLVLIFSLSTLHGQVKFKNIPSSTSQGDQKANLSPIQTQWKSTGLAAKVNYNPTTIPFSISKGQTKLHISHWNEHQLPKAIILDIDVSEKNTSQQKLNTVLNKIKHLIKIKDITSSIVISKDYRDDLNVQHIHFDQVYQGIPIFGTEGKLHIKNGKAYLMQANFVPNVDVQTEASIGIDRIYSHIISLHPDYDENFAANIDRLNVNTDQWHDELGIFTDKKFVNKPVLAYRIEMHPNMGEHMVYYIDAHTNEVIHSYSSICKFHHHSKGHTDCDHTPPDGETTSDARDLTNTVRRLNTYQVGNDYFLIDATRPMYDQFGSSMPNDPQGVIWTIDAFDSSPQGDNFKYDHVSSPNNTWSGREEGISAHYNAELSYTYFKNTFNRESIDGSGGNVVSFVNVADKNGRSMGNAFWNGFAIFYGNGDDAFLPLGRGLDVAGHEMSHGVVQNTANLEYFGESGAMNESFADIFGAMIDRDDWQIGEEVVRSQFFPSGALRSMSDPHNGAAQGDFQRGWQPRHYNERYTGQEDNNGVHINSGISNYAFYLTATNIGRSKSEQIYYRALSQYLTKSSQFSDLRVAVEQATRDLYGSSELSAVQNAFNTVGIQGGTTTQQQDADINPGTDFILYSDENLSTINLIRPDGTEVAVPLSSVSHISKPSVTDAGDAVVFIGSDKKMYLITLDWDQGSANQEIIQDEPIWRSVVISKDGFRIAALEEVRTPQFGEEESNNIISVFDFTVSAWREFELFNPTYTQGVSTGEVQYADALEFDITGQFIMYDALNVVESSNAGSIEYWDIGFLKVWNNELDSWSLGQISKLFTALPEGISVGNPTYSKNSPDIIALDYLEDNSFKILAANVETGEVNEVFDNSGIGYPNFSRTDEFLIFGNEGQSSNDLAILELDNTKMRRVQGTERLILRNARWGVWFSNGLRDLNTRIVDIHEEVNAFNLYPNPTTESINLDLKLTGKYDCVISIVDMQGKVVYSNNHLSEQQIQDQIHVSHLQSGSYFLNITLNTGKIISKSFIKR